MKTKRLVHSLCCLCLMTSSSMAGGSGLFGSYWSTEDADAGYGGGIKAIVGDGRLALELRGTYFGDLTDDVGPADIDLQAIPAEAGLLFTLGETADVVFHIGAGGGYYFLDSDQGDIDDEIGWYASGGLDLKITPNVALFAEAVYRQVEGTAPDDQFEDIDGNVDFSLNGAGVNVGLAFR
ncbi:MAG TPA: outer membrane beta-barrel protein [Kiritimatiellia bacterium]